MIKKTLITTLLMICALMIVAPVNAQDDEQHAINIALANEDVATVLADIDDYSVEAYPEEEGLWGVEFFIETDDDWQWLGWVLVDMETAETIEVYMVRFLTEDELATIAAEAEQILLNDPEVLAALIDPELWEVYTWYIPEDQTYFVEFYRSIDAYVASFYLWDEDEELVLHFDSFTDGNALEAQEQIAHDRDTAILIAYESDDLYDAIADVDEWEVYAQNIRGSQWSIEFVSGNQRLYYALIDIETETVLESVAGSN